jgi:hypothetical protein
MPPKKAAVGMKKPRAVAPKVKPANMSNADWEKEPTQRAVVTADQQRRRVIQRQQECGGRPGRVFRKLHREPGNECR